MLIALAGCGGGTEEDPRAAVATAIATLHDAVGDDPARVDGRALCAGLDSRTRESVERLGREITGVSSTGRCADVLVAARWRVRPFAATGPVDPVDLDRITVTGDTATLRPEGRAAAPLRFRRSGDEWVADLLAEPRWRYRLERNRACTAAGRRFARLRLPRSTPASTERYLREQVAILRRFEQDVAGDRAPFALRKADAKLVRTLRQARRRAEATARRVGGDTVAAAEALAAISRRGWDPAAQLPGEVSRGVYPITQGCTNALSLGSAGAAGKRVKRRCEAVGRRLQEYDGVDSPAAFDRVTGRVATSVRELGRAIDRQTPSPLIADVHGQTVRNARRWAGELQALVGPVRSGDLPGFEAGLRQLYLSGSVLDRGLAQLGVVCSLPERLPKAPSDPA